MKWCIRCMGTGKKVKARAGLYCKPCHSRAKKNSAVAGTKLRNRQDMLIIREERGEATFGRRLGSLDRSQSSIDSVIAWLEDRDKIESHKHTNTEE